MRAVREVADKGVRDYVSDAGLIPEFSLIKLGITILADSNLIRLN